MNAEIATWDGRFHGEQSPHITPHFRKGQTDARDRDVWQACFVENEYGLPPLHANDVIIDIGMHVGSFCCRAYANGSRKVYGYEVDRSAWITAVANTLEFGPEIHPFNLAVVRSDEPLASVRYVPGSMRTTATGDASAEGSLEAKTIAFDDILRELGPVRFLKIDCEGSEWPILYTSKMLSSVHEIAGEYHEMDALPGLPPSTAAALGEYLACQGFYFEAGPANGGIGLFSARRFS